VRTFAEIFATNDTDKQSRHGYGDTYDRLLGRHRTTARKILELGVDRGGSLMAWLEAFPDADVCGVDIRPVEVSAPRLSVIEADAYDPRFAQSVPCGWDVIVDDGPHTLPSMLAVAALYTPKLAPGGTLIIEDVPAPLWLPKLAKKLPANYRARAFSVDLSFSGASDSRLFVVDMGGP
jgi:cephalosporin hydroxylase